MNKVAKFSINVLLTIASFVAALVAYPMYVVYSFGKALCDIDRFSDFF